MSAAPLPVPGRLDYRPAEAAASFTSRRSSAQRQQQQAAAPPARADESHQAAFPPPPPRMLSDVQHQHQQHQQYNHRRQDDSLYPSTVLTQGPYVSAPPAWMSTSSASAYPATYLQEEKRLGTAGSGSLDRILHSRGAGAFEDERQQNQDSAAASPNAGGLSTPHGSVERASATATTEKTTTTTTTWGEEPSTASTPAETTSHPRASQALPSPADTQSSGVSWGPPPTDAGSYLRPQWSTMATPHSLYPLTPQNHTPLPSLANDPRLYVDDYDYHPPVNLLPPSISIPGGGDGQDAQEAFRYQASFQPTPVDFQLQQPLPAIVPYGHDNRPLQRTSALTPPPSSTHTSGPSLARGEVERPKRRAKRHKQTSHAALGRSSSSGASSMQSGKVLKTDRPFACDICTQSFNRRHDLTRHHRTHEEDRPWPCTNCTKAFTRKDALRRHLLVKKECGRVVELPKSAAAMRRDREARKQADSAARRCKDGSAGESGSGDEDEDEDDETDSGRAYSQTAPLQPQHYQPYQQQQSLVVGYLPPIVPASESGLYPENPSMHYPQQQQYPLQQVPYGQKQYSADGRYAYGNDEDLRLMQPNHVDLSYEAPSPRQAYRQQQQQQQLGVQYPPPVIRHPGSSGSSSGTHSRSSSSHAGSRPVHSRHSSVQSIHSAHSMHTTLSAGGAHSQHGSVPPGGHPSDGNISAAAGTLSPHPPRGAINPAVSPAHSHSSSFYGQQQQQQQQQGSSPLPPGASRSLPADRSPYTPGPTSTMSGLGINNVQLPSVQYASFDQGDYGGESARLPPPQAYYDTPPQPQPQAQFAGPNGYASQQHQQQDGGSPYMHSAGPSQQHQQQQPQQAEWYPPPLAQTFQETANAY